MIKIDCKFKLSEAHLSSSFLFNLAIWQYFVDTNLFKLWLASLGLDILADRLVVSVALLPSHTASLMSHATTFIHLDPALT